MSFKRKCQNVNVKAILDKGSRQEVLPSVCFPFKCVCRLQFLFLNTFESNINNSWHFTTLQVSIFIKAFSCGKRISFHFEWHVQYFLPAQRLSPLAQFTRFTTRRSASTFIQGAKLHSIIRLKWMTLSSQLDFCAFTPYFVSSAVVPWKSIDNKK